MDASNDPLAKLTALANSLGITLAKDLAGTPEDVSHEIGHWLVAPKRRRNLPNFGLGTPGGGLIDPTQLVSEEWAEREERAASLLGIGLLIESGAEFECYRQVIWYHNWPYYPTGARRVLKSKALRRHLKPRALNRLTKLVNREIEKYQAAIAGE